MAKKKDKPADPSIGHGTRVYSGRGVLFVVADDRETMGVGATTITVIAEAIEDALSNGCETSHEIAAWITTSSFNYEPDKRVRFNSLLRAGDAAGAQIVRKLYNAYNELAETATNPELTPRERWAAKAEASGFAEALSIATSPFSCEDPIDKTLVDWEKVDQLASMFEAEQQEMRHG